jgi:hypothetical protein
MVSSCLDCRLWVQIRVLRLLSRSTFDTLSKEEISLTNKPKKFCLILKARILANI